MSHDERIAVIGGGVVGITTAVLLQANGHRAVVYATARPSDFPRAKPPAFASLHAAASILPHSVASPRATGWTAASQAYFRRLTESTEGAVRRQRHYEIFEREDPPLPSYHDSVPDFETLSQADLHARRAPIRPGAASASGWSFSAFFCEAPRYLRFLYDLFRAIGGEVTPSGFLPDPPSLTSYLELDHSVYVLCAGYSSPALLNAAAATGGHTDRPSDEAFEPLADPCAARLIRGHYLSLDVKGPLSDSDGRAFSYNYTPSREIYPPPGDAAADVYCYPRSDGWMLGGSRQIGRLAEGGAWAGETTAGEEIEFPGADGPIRVPAPIFRLNRDLLFAASAGVDLDAARDATPPRVTAGVGYRFVRENDDDHVRLGVSRLDDGNEKFVIHNYGHGGAGYTLSWGCALDVLQLVERSTSSAPAAVSTAYPDAGRTALIETTRDLRARAST
jgi:D-amino-acid oxidase